MALFDACVDLNPHQIDAAAFALRNPLSKGVLLADEVGLGKTIEAGLVLCQYWAERKRRLLVIAAEKELADTKAQIKASRRQSRMATTLDEQNDLQQRLSTLEKKQRKQRQQIFEIEDQIAEKRDKLIDGLQRRMSQKTKITPLFTIQWQVV